MTRPLLQPSPPVQLSHVDHAGRARMVDVSAKGVTRRRARACALVRLSLLADRLLQSGELPKGNAFEVVRFAAIQAAKQTAQLIPLCHPLKLTQVDAELVRIGPVRPRGSGATSRSGARGEPAGEALWQVTTTVAAVDRTGVEMEALTAASVGALALYDMVKAVDRGAVIEQVVLLEKSGGKSGHFQRSAPSAVPAGSPVAVARRARRK